MFKSDKEGNKAWYGEMKDLITEGRWADSLEKLDTESSYGDCNLHNYIKNNGYRMNYPEYKEKGSTSLEAE